MQRPDTVRLRTQLYREAVRIIEAEYGSELELADVARRIATSPRQLQRAFAEIGDTSFRDELTRVRMDRAAELLRASSLTVRAVAARVGYRQPAQFAKSFRSHHGAVPSAYRVQHAAGAQREHGYQAAPQHLAA